MGGLSYGKGGMDMEEKELQEARLPAFQIRDPVFELSNHGDYLLVK